MVLCNIVVVDTKTGKESVTQKDLTIEPYVPHLVPDVIAEINTLKAKVSALEAKP
jgi:hypothetical protein